MTNVSKLYLDRPCFRPQSLEAFLVAAAIVVIAIAIRLPLEPLVDGWPYLVFFPAVIIATFLCGSAAGFLAAIASILSARLLIQSLDIAQVSLYQTLVFTVGATSMVVVIGAVRAATADVRRLNETLRVSEEKFRGLLESAPDAMVIVDDRQRISLINAQTEDLFGYHRTELLGQPIATLMPERNWEQYAAQLAAFRVNPGVAPPEAVTLHGLRKDGSEFPIEVSLGPLETEAGVVVSNAIRDITARRLIEAKLAKTSKAKSDFLAGLSHELRTPLNAIIGFSELIRDAVIGPVDARYRTYARDINDSGHHLQNIINDILDISKVEGGHLALRDEIVSIGDTVEACRRIVAAMADAADVALSTEIPVTLPLLRSDQLRFRQILLNLMSNAVKFTPGGGSVRVAATLEADGIVIAIVDTGIGMKPEDIEVALEPFRQIDGPLSRRFDGTGLGLPLANALVKLHGGRLDIESAPGAGTTMRIRLPRERVADAATAATIAAPGGFAPAISGRFPRDRAVGQD